MIRSNWLNFWLGLALGSLTLYPPLGRATPSYPTECDQANPDLCSTGLVEGQVAPFTGQLLTTKLAITLGQKAEWQSAKWELEAKRLKELHQIDLDLEKTKARVEREAMQAQIDLFQKRLEEALKTPWYKEPWCVAGVSIILTACVFSLAIKGASLLK